jgi:hypothetical protein
MSRALDLKAGDEVSLARGDGDVIEIERRRDGLRALRRYRGLLPHASFDRAAANGR